MPSLTVPPAPFLTTHPTGDDPVAALLLSRLPVAAVLLDAEGRVAQANVAGRAILDGQDGLQQGSGGWLQASIALEDRRLRLMLGEVLASMENGDGSAGGCPPFRVHRPSGRTPYLLVVDPNRTKVEPLTTTVALLVRIIDAEPEREGLVYPLQAAFELTAAEARIAESIATGRSPGRTAQDLALSRNTVRTHLARIFDKTGVRSQHALVRLLMTLGSWPTA